MRANKKLVIQAARNKLFGFFVIRVFSALRAILGKYESVRIVLLILDAVVVSALAFGAFKRNFGSCRFGCHNQNSIQKITPLDRRVELVYHTFERLSIFFAPFSNFFYIFTKGIFRAVFNVKNHPFHTILYIRMRTPSAHTGIHDTYAHAWATRRRIMRIRVHAHVGARAVKSSRILSPAL